MELLLRDSVVQTVFDLMGTSENDLTFSTGFGLARSPTLLARFLERLELKTPARDISAVRLQTFGQDRGYTDVELEAPGLRIILEAKKGWTLPSGAQLKRYVGRIKVPIEAGVLVVLSECSDAYTRIRGVSEIDGYPIIYMSWRSLSGLVSEATTHSSGTIEKHVLRELGSYMSRASQSQNQFSNLAYVLALAQGTPPFSNLSWRDVVERAGHYFHPYASGKWPVQPPNYLAFRYGGCLRSIHHVERAEVVADVHEYMPEIAPGAVTDHVLYWLGPAIRPVQAVRNGRIWPNGRYWAAIDLLLTCETISEARDQTHERWSGREIG